MPDARDSFGIDDISNESDMHHSARVCWPQGTAKATKEEKGEDGDDASSMSSGGSAEDAFASDDEKLDMDD